MDVFDIALFGFVALVFAVVLAILFLYGEEVGRIAVDRGQVKPWSSRATLIVKRGPQGRQVQLQVRLTLLINAWSLSPAEAEELAVVLEEALQRTRA